MTENKNDYRLLTTVTNDQSVNRYRIPTELYQTHRLRDFVGAEESALPEEIREGIACGNFVEVDIDTDTPL